MNPIDLPINDALPALLAALQSEKRAVLQAPPGAGKTTVVPLAMLEAGVCDGRILVLEPRRLAARAAAERMAESLGQKPGQIVGYRIRGESRVSNATRIEVVTEGILTRMIQSDPSLAGIGAVIFDEFHERSLNADLGLALTWEARNALRDDLLILVMSATLDAAPVAAMLGNAPMISSDGRAFAVETHWLDRPAPKLQRFVLSCADLVAQAVTETAGGVLVFLPGEGEIRRVDSALAGQLPNDCTIHPLFGSMDFRAQRAAIAPARTGRKIVLATAIAETSLTIQDIRVVVDCGQSRRARFDPGSGMSRLVTERVTKAEAEQRRGRAGRVAQGTCYRMWTKAEQGGLRAFPPAEIDSADLTGLVLELALWGTATTDSMAFLTHPNPGAFTSARNLLRDLGALDDGGRITQHGRQLALIPLHPRLGHMLETCGKGGAELAALLGDRDPLRGATADMLLRKDAIRNPARMAREKGIAINRATVERIKSEAKRLTAIAPHTDQQYSWAAMAAIAYPDRVGLRRPGDDPRWVLSGGKGAKMAPDDPLATARLIIATDLDGDAREARIRTAIKITEAEVRGLFSRQIEWRNFCEWSRKDRRIIARQQQCLGALVLADRLWNDVPPAAVEQAVIAGIRDLGLTMSDAARRFQARAELVRDGGDQLPDLSDEWLMAHLEDWLTDHLQNVKSANDIKNLDVLEPLRLRLNWEQSALLDRLAPAHYRTPMDRKTPIDYSGQFPAISVRLQEMFGLTTHPCVGPSRVPLRITLLSPAQRPLQTTTDLPGFWATSYGDVRKDMRGQYPRHPWPEDPTAFAPTLRAKSRKR